MFDSEKLTNLLLAAVPVQEKRNQKDLLKFKMFSLLEQSELHSLACRVLRAEYRPGEVIYSKSSQVPQQRADKVCMILKGQVFDNKAKIHLKKNEIFGVADVLKAKHLTDCGLVHGVPRAAAVKAQRRYTVPFDCPDETTQIMAIHMADFFKVMPRAEIEKLERMHGISHATVLAEAAHAELAFARAESQSRTKNKLGKTGREGSFDRHRTVNFKDLL